MSDDNFVDINSKLVNKWIAHNWQVPATSVIYNRSARTVNIHFKQMEIATNTAIYPILNSHVDNNKKTALSPFKMVDFYNSDGYIVAGGHSPATMAGFKICLSDIGISASVRKIDKNKNKLWPRFAYRIYPSLPQDYACFAMYFSDDLVEPNRKEFSSFGQMYFLAPIVPIKCIKLDAVIKNDKVTIKDEGIDVGN